MYTPVPMGAPSDVSLCTGETFLIRGGVSDDVLVDVLVFPLFQQAKLLDHWSMVVYLAQVQLQVV